MARYELTGTGLAHLPASNDHRLARPTPATAPPMPPSPPVSRKKLTTVPCQERISPLATEKRANVLFRRIKVPFENIPVLNVFEQ